MSNAPAATSERPGYFTTGWTGGRNPWAIALVVTMATFMEVLDTSIANVSLPHIAGQRFRSRTDEATWVLTSATWWPTRSCSRSADGSRARFGRKRFYMTCVGLFTASSLIFVRDGAVAGMRWSSFASCRASAAAVWRPSEQSILADTFPPEKRGMAMALYGMAVVLAPAIGPTLGGFITEHYNWRWIFFINVPVGMLSMYLTNRMVTDPPHLKTLRDKKSSIDYIGLALIALGLGTLEVVLDKGQEDDWFHSPFIVAFSIIAAIALTAFVLWEWNHKSPVVDVRMFKDRNFAASNVMMLVLGVTMFGTTVLLPQYTQVLMGYTAEQAGMALSPGGFVVILLLPLVGRLVSKVDARWLIAFGFIVMSAALMHMTSTLYQGIDFKTATLLRCYQAVGMAFLFVPINTLVYVGIAPDKSNAVSGIVNLSRNMGGDIGIAFVTTLIARRSQVHQANLSASTTSYNPAFQAKLQGITTALQHAGASSTEAAQKALHVMYGQLLQQSATLAYLDAFKVLGISTALMVPLLLLTRKPGGKPIAGH